MAHLDPEFVVLIVLSALGLAGAHFFLRRRMSRGMPWLVWSLVAVVLAGTGWLAADEGRAAMAQIRQIVGGMAPSYAQGMVERGIAGITCDTPEDDPGYLSMIEKQKRWLAANPAIADIYTFGKRADGKTVLLVDSETDYNRDGVFDDDREARTAIGEEYDDDSENIDRAFAGQSVFVDEVVEDRWGQWVSAYEPMRDEAGLIVGVLGVDFPAKQMVATVTQARRGTLSMGAVLIVLITFGGTFGAMLRASVDHERVRARQSDEHSRAKSEFLANMSHEIRTPMTAILGYAELLSDHAYPDAEREVALRTIRRQGEHLVGLINDILDLSKIESGRMTVETHDVDAVAVATEVAALLRVRASAKGIDLRTDWRMPLPATIRADPMRLRQVLLNIVGNAVKFTERGSVTLRFSCVDRRPVFEIVDTGIGMSPEQRDRLFRPYEQADMTTSRRFGGTGLGLVISKQFVELMRGTVSLESTPGAGTTCRIEFPPVASDARMVDRVATAAPAAASSTASRLCGRILLAEDGPDNQRLISFILRKAGADVEVEEHGPTVLRKALERHASGSPYDLILLDMQLPEMEGHEIATRLRTADYRGPIAALTAQAMGGDRERCLASGCDEYLTKPIDRVRLIEACATLMARARATNADRKAA